MTFRYARHTTDLERIEQFYTAIVGLERLGGFQNHNNYNGVFLGLTGADWHLEFTTSNEKPISTFDADDTLVFYVNSAAEIAQLKAKLKRKNIAIEDSRNPYWVQNGIQISDPDGYKVVFALKSLSISANDRLTALVTAQNIHTWSDLIDFTCNLPYGRNLNRHDFSLVVQEGKGTCSSKHAFLKKVADLNGFKQVKLLLGIYKMNQINTPKIGTTLIDSGLEYLPEAHCYLNLNNLRIDITSPKADFQQLAQDILEEIEIEPEQVNTFKVEYHKNYLKQWLVANDIDKSFDEVWNIREQCIKKLEGLI